MDNPTAVPRLLLTEVEAGEATGFTRRALQNWRLRGEGPAYVQVGRNVRYRPEDLAAWIAARARRTSTSDAGKAA